MDSLSVIKMLKNKIFDRDCFYFYNVLQEFVYQHFSKRRNKNITNELNAKKAVMETNTAPILNTNICMALLQKIKYKMA